GQGPREVCAAHQKRQRAFGLRERTMTSQWIQTASHWGVYEVETRDGIACSARPVAWDADPSPIIQALPAGVQGALRVSEPFVRRGYLRYGPGRTSAERGADAYVAVKWDRAMRLVAEELLRVRGTHGNQAISAGRTAGRAPGACIIRRACSSAS